MARARKATGQKASGHKGTGETFGGPHSGVPGALPAHLVVQAVKTALNEDLGLAGDITTDATIAPDVTARGMFAARADGVVSGLEVAAATFVVLDRRVAFEPLVQDGMRVTVGTVIAEVAGPARAILTGERVALNFLGRMSGIASLTRQYVDAVAGTGAAIADTRKTTPGLRAFEKYAVRCGGGVNHRIGLFDAVLIKDNHIIASGGIEAAITAARARAGHLVKIEVEVDTLDQLDAALRHPIDAVLLDNMSRDELCEAVRRVELRRAAGARIVTEASGGVNLSTVRAIAESGVDLISVGALTHSAPVLDLGLDFDG